MDIHYVRFETSKEGLGGWNEDTLRPMGQSVFVNNLLWEESWIHSFMYYLGLQCAACSLPRSIVTKDHKRKGLLNSGNFRSHGSGGWNSVIKVAAGLCLFRRHEGSSPCGPLSWLLVVARLVTMLTPALTAVVFSLCVSVVRSACFLCEHQSY